MDPADIPKTAILTPFGLQENGLTINPSKCTFAVSSVKFLGHMVDGNGIVPLPRHVQAIQEFPPPADIKQLQQFLGLVNF
jgi:hypothetical protein